MQQVKTLLLGLGKIGLGYDLDNPGWVKTHARALSMHPGFKLCAAVDPDSDSRKLFEKNYRVQAYESLEEVVTGSHFDFVVVSTPTDTHLEMIEKILKVSSPKAILCEKPLAQVLQGAEKIVQLCSSSGTGLYVNYIRRTDPAVLQIQQLIEDERVKLPLKGFAWYSKGFLHNASHLFDLLVMWLGKVVDYQLINVHSSIEANDCLVDVQIKFEKGSVIFSNTPGEGYPLHSIDLLSSSGRIKYDYGGNHVSWLPYSNITSVSGSGVLSKREVFDSGLDQYQLNLLSHVQLAMSGQSHNLCTGELALRNQEVINSIIDSIK